MARPRDESPLNASTDSTDAIRPSPEEIAVRAYGLYQHRGSIDGSDMADWLQAERELVDERRRKLATV